MPDEAPEGQSQDPGGDTGPEATWWPWPETQPDEATGPRDGAPGVDETLSLPVEARPVAVPDEAGPDEAASPVLEPDPAPEPVLEPEPQPEPGRALDLAPSPMVVPAIVMVAPTGEAQPPPVALPATDDLLPGNEPVPAMPAEVGTGPIGSIPAAHARAVWSRLQASNWRLFLIRFLSAGLAVVLTVAIVPGLGFTAWQWGDFTRIAVIFGLLNATVKPLLQFLVLRFIFSTYGIVVVIINALLLLLLGGILEDTFRVYRPVSLVIGGLVVGVLGLILETLLGGTPPTLDRDYKERNGLP